MVSYCAVLSGRSRIKIPMAMAHSARKTLDWKTLIYVVVVGFTSRFLLAAVGDHHKVMQTYTIFPIIIGRLAEKT